MHNLPARFFGLFHSCNSGSCQALLRAGIREDLTARKYLQDAPEKLAFLIVVEEVSAIGASPRVCPAASFPRAQREPLRAPEKGI
jgi:hypothetical protein